ncbi:hypothetical protein CGLUCO_08430 [Corynebacterium glucuronolyticum DSM 44120]|nr:hypothetical protein CGLUCO_08430 [Corynebacterium glucuronolyticum DSM 44120]
MCGYRHHVVGEDLLPGRFFPLRFRQFPAGDPRIHGFSPFGVGYVCSGPCLAAGLVTGFGMACFCPCLKMIRGVMPPKAVTYFNC